MKEWGFLLLGDFIVIFDIVVFVFLLVFGYWWVWVLVGF